MLDGFAWTFGWVDGNFLDEKVYFDAVDDGASDEPDCLWSCAEAAGAF